MRVSVGMLGNVSDCKQMLATAFVCWLCIWEILRVCADSHTLSLSLPLSPSLTHTHTHTHTHTELQHVIVAPSRSSQNDQRVTLLEPFSKNIVGFVVSSTQHLLSLSLSLTHTHTHTHTDTHTHTFLPHVRSLHTHTPSHTHTHV